MVFGSAGWDCYSGDCDVIAMKSGGKPPSQLANVANVRNVTTFACPEVGLAPALPTPPPSNQRFINSTNLSNRYSESCGPGADSGWYCTENTGSVL